MSVAAFSTHAVVSDVFKSVTQSRQIEISTAMSVGPKNKPSKSKFSSPPKMPSKVQMRQLDCAADQSGTDTIISQQDNDHAEHKQ